jgi:hypothetical protein
MLVSVIFIVAGIGISAALLSANNSQEPQVQVQEQYVNLSEKLLNEFLIAHNDYTPEILAQRCAEDPKWTALGISQSGNIVYLAVALPDGIMAFGYGPESIQPICTFWTPKIQPWSGKPLSIAYAGVLEASIRQFEQNPWIMKKDEGIIIYKLNKNIVAVIAVGENGEYLVSIGFIENLPMLKDLKDA